MTLMIG